MGAAKKTRSAIERINTRNGLLFCAPAIVGLASLARELSLVLYDGGRLDDPESHEFLCEGRLSGVIPSAWRQVT